MDLAAELEERIAAVSKMLVDRRLGRSKSRWLVG
jgi:hypothetical protein